MVILLENAVRTTKPTLKTRRIRPISTEQVSLSRRAIEDERAFVPMEGVRSPSYLLVKRLLDIVGASVLVVAFAPVMAVVFGVLLFTTKGKPLFFQKRLGYQGKPFWMIKFRTMIVDADKKQVTVINEKDGPIFKNRRDKTIFLNIDPEANYGMAVRVIDTVRNSGLEKLAVITLKKGEKFQIPSAPTTTTATGVEVPLGSGE